MKRASHVACALVLLCAACQGESVTAVNVAQQAPSLLIAGNSGCHTVKGTISETGVFPNFAGSIAGDLIGTSTTTLSFDVSVTGAVFHNPGERTFVITGGTVPGLGGKTLHETFEGVTVFRAGPLVLINARTRIDDGAERGHLTEHGTVDLRPFPWEVELGYQGVVCP